MGFDPHMFDDSQQKLLKMLVQNVFRKNDVRPNTRSLTTQQKREIRNTIKKLQQQTEAFLNNTQQLVTEDDVNPVSNMVEEHRRNVRKIRRRK